MRHDAPDSSQTTLFDVEPRGKYQAHSQTSIDAAKSVVGKSHTERNRVLAWLRAFGPATDEQMQDALDMNPSTQRPRRVELVEMGFIYDTGKTAKTKSGRSAVLWGTVRIK